VPSNQVAHHFGVLALRRDGCQCRLDNPRGISFKKRRGVHRADELAGVEAVAVIHEPAELLAEVNGRLRHSGRDQA
jgi:hypothetical protein